MNEWHDLRKNPDDLPKPRKGVLLCVKEKGIDCLSTRYTHYYYYVVGFYFYNKNHEGLDWQSSSGYIYGDRQVIAWKEIEEFEV